jgi:hypothetical protein
MKIPICPKCHEPNTLKLIDIMSGPEFDAVAGIRCMKVNGGCGEVFGVFNLEVVDSSGCAVTFYREATLNPDGSKRERARGNGDKR